MKNNIPISSNKKPLIRFLYIFAVFTIILNVIFFIFFIPESEENFTSKPSFLNSIEQPINNLFNKNVKLLINGDEALYEVIKMMNESKRSINMRIFTWRDDLIGYKVAEHVLMAADRGVKIKIRKDSIASIHEKSEQEKRSFLHPDMNWKTIVQQLFLDFFYGNRKYNGLKQRKNVLRDKIFEHENIELDIDYTHDHSKVYIFDGEIIIMGGINIEDSETKLYNKVQWDDYMVKFFGKDIVDYYLKRDVMKMKYNKNSKVEFILNRKINGVEYFEQKRLLIDILKASQSSIVIQNPYWGDIDIIDVLSEKCNEVDITIFYPREPNLQKHIITDMIAKLYNRCNGKVNIFMNPNMLHGKTVLIDDRYIWIGSSNFNKASMNRMQESNAFFDAIGLDILLRFKTHLEQKKLKCKKVSSPDDFEYSKTRAYIESFFL